MSTLKKSKSAISNSNRKAAKNTKKEKTGKSGKFGKSGKNGKKYTMKPNKYINHRKLPKNYTMVLRGGADKPTPRPGFLDTILKQYYSVGLNKLGFGLDAGMAMLGYKRHKEREKVDFPESENKLRATEPDSGSAIRAKIEAVSDMINKQIEPALKENVYPSLAVAEASASAYVNSLNAAAAAAAPALTASLATSVTLIRVQLKNVKKILGNKKLVKDFDKVLEQITKLSDKFVNNLEPVVDKHLPVIGEIIEKATEDLARIIITATGNAAHAIPLAGTMLGFITLSDQLLKFYQSGTNFGAAMGEVFGDVFAEALVSAKGSIQSGIASAKKAAADFKESPAGKKLAAQAQAAKDSASEAAASVKAKANENTASQSGGGGSYNGHNPPIYPSQHLQIKSFNDTITDLASELDGNPTPFSPPIQSGGTYRTDKKDTIKNIVSLAESNGELDDKFGQAKFFITLLGNSPLYEPNLENPGSDPSAFTQASQVFEAELQKKNKRIHLTVPERHSIFISQERKLADEFQLDSHPIDLNPRPLSSSPDFELDSKFDSYLENMTGGQSREINENTPEYNIHKALFIRQLQNAEMDEFDDLNVNNAITTYNSILQQMENDKGKEMPKLTEKQMMNIYNEIEDKTAKDFDYATSHQLDKFNLDLDSIGGGNNHAIAINK